MSECSAITLMQCPDSVKSFECGAFEEDGTINGKKAFTVALPNGDTPAYFTIWYGADSKAFLLGPKEKAGTDEKHCLAYAPGEGIDLPIDVKHQWCCINSSGKGFTPHGEMYCVKATVKD
mmetsp:Transcript_649/g.1101  ORF Transcript_649/g.1101 Transcript_649/m.1101 type:complete len:120 (-) Transcript_649:66-425(-)